MKWETDVNTVDFIPREGIMYFVMEKPYVVPDSQEGYKIHNPYQVGDPVVVKMDSLDDYHPTFKAFIQESCRAATSEEAERFHREIFSNARIGKTYEDGTFLIRRFFIVESHTKELFEKLDLEKENCIENINLSFIKLLEKLCDVKFMHDVCAGYYQGKLFLYTNFYVVDNKHLLKICRRATPKETTELNLFVKEVQERNPKSNN